MEQGDYMYIIALGEPEDWEAGRGSLYYIEDRNGERAMPVFTSTEKAESYARANLHRPEAHMQMLESISVAHTPPLTEGRFVFMPLDWEGVASAALTAEVDYLIRDPRPGDQQEILRVPK